MAYTQLRYEFEMFMSNKLFAFKIVVHVCFAIFVVVAIFILLLGSPVQ